MGDNGTATKLYPPPSLNTISGFLADEVQLVGSIHRNCSGYKDLIIPCSESGPQDICTPTVVSTFLNRVTLNFPYFGAFCFWGQFVFLGVYLITFLTGLVKTPRLEDRTADEQDAENDEDESLLAASTSRPDGTVWQDVRGSRGNGSYGSTGRSGRDTADEG